MLKTLDRLEAGNFHAVEILCKEDIWPAFKALMSHERRDEDSAV